ncbi:MAG: hypothetical protein IKI33_04110, partial [Eubacterium sp.]|nr:hypothetical protein [Eubacterium sp.]
MKKALSFMLSILLIISVFAVVPFNAQAAGYGVKNPTVKDDVATWDCVYFGKYYIKNEKTKEPVKWRVLSVNGSDAFLLADKSVDCKTYHTADTDVTWETCSLRSWLNGSFYNAAFTSNEKSAIKTVDVESVTYDGYVNTKDNVYLLSCKEAENAAYGFTDNDDTRISKNTAYTTSLGAYTYKYSDDIIWSASSEGAKYNGSGYWWLRDSDCDGRYYNYAFYVWKDGTLSSRGTSITDSTNTVRPCLHIDLSSSVWSYAGTVSSDGSFCCANHSWDKGTVSKEATYTQAGIKTFKCTVCGAEKTKAIKKLAKSDNTLAVTGKTVTLRYAKLKKKSCKIKRSAAITVKKAQGTVTYKKLSVNKKITINKKTGNISVKKGLKKGVYKIKIQVKASGN